MANSNCVAEVVAHLTKAVKAKDTTEQTPAQWATAAGFKGSEASPLRRVIARVSENGCGRNARYRAMTAKELLELIDMGQSYSKGTDTKKAQLHKQVRGKLYPATRAGARQAKSTARKSTRKAKA